MQSVFNYGNKKVGGDNPVLIIAEIGINYDDDYDQALAHIDVAVDAGCDVVKFQLFKAERMYAKNAGKYKIASGEKKDIIEIIKANELRHEWIPEFKKYAEDKGVEFLVTVCDEESGDVLERNNVAGFKIASYAITHLPLLRNIARKGKPIIFSCGGATIAEVHDAISVMQEEGLQDIALMHCVGQYPAPRESLNLRAIQTLVAAFPDVVVGYSDHSLDPFEAPKVAVALGAKVIEKHITLDRNLPGPDHSFATNPKELKKMVSDVREVEVKLKKGEKIDIDETILGTSAREIYEEEKEKRPFLYRTIFATEDIKAGEAFTSKNIAVLRPGENPRGLEPKYYDLLIDGYKATRDIPDNKPIDWDDCLTK